MQVSVKSVREKDSQMGASRGTRLYSARRQYLSLAFLLLTTTVLLLTVIFAARASAGKTALSSPANRAADLEAASAEAPNAAPQDYSKFSHTSPGEHAGFASASSCDSCHQRNGTQAQPGLPGHKACINCHLAQFTTANVAMCNICHTGDLGGSSPPVKGFPGMRSFRVSFDHAQHTRIGANCARCHAPARRGVALSIPASLNAHVQCYSCHSPGQSAASLSSCGTCHSVGGYSRTSSNARAFGFSFSHATHGARQRLSCANCHNVSAGAPQSRQVSSPATFQHFPRSRAQSCATCHNGQRAFGEADFGDCKKCHKGQTFRMGF
jgi:c(7)-type cytochrome triheme protein